MNELVLQKVQKYILEQFKMDTTGHDYFHVERVVNTAKYLANQENADVFLVSLAAWVHDMGDYKLTSDGKDHSIEEITALLTQLEVDEVVIEKVVKIVSEVGFTKGKVPSSIEGKIVQDADRLDAIGAIGVARAFAYGGSKKRMLYDPTKQDKENTIQHFYDKLLLLKDKLNTNSAKILAHKKHQFMTTFLDEFYVEWNANYN